MIGQGVALLVLAYAIGTVARLLLRNIFCRRPAQAEFLRAREAFDTARSHGDIAAMEAAVNLMQNRADYMCAMTTITSDLFWPVRDVIRLFGSSR